jgi:hypothetical protein
VRFLKANLEWLVTLNRRRKIGWRASSTRFGTGGDTSFNKNLLEGLGPKKIVEIFSVMAVELH